MVKNRLTIGEERAYNVHRKGQAKMDNMTNKQLQFITWLITTATDKCQTIEEVRELNAEIRKHSDGLVIEDFEKQEE